MHEHEISSGKHSLSVQLRVFQWKRVVRARFGHKQGEKAEKSQWKRMETYGNGSRIFRPPLQMTEEHAMPIETHSLCVDVRVFQWKRVLARNLSMETYGNVVL